MEVDAMRQYRRYPPEVTLPAVMAALEAGRSIGSITSGRGGPLIIRAYGLRRLMAANPEWSARAAPLIKANALAANARKSEWLRKRTHCNHGHSFHDALMVNRGGYRYRVCRTCRSLEVGAPMNAAIKEKVAAIIKKGEPITTAIKSVRSSFPTIARWRNEDPEFNKLIETFRPVRIENQYNRMAATNRRNATHRRIAKEKNIYHKIHAMIPKWIAEKDELVSDVFVLIGARTIQDDEIAGLVAQAVAAHNKLFPLKFRKFGDARLISLDELAFEDGSTTIGDQVSRGLWD
jgi:hypothetical protein